MIKKTAHSSAGFTLVELLVVLSMITIIVSLSSINLTGLISTTSFDENLELIVSDLRRQQFRTLVGEEQSNSSKFGIHFENTQYILFVGDTYVAADANNLAISLPPNLVFESITLPSGSVVFVEGTGEVLNYNADTDSVTIREISSNESKQLEFNMLGVVDVL